MWMKARRIAAFAPALLPIGCALGVMVAALTLHARLSRPPGDACCGSAEVTWPESAGRVSKSAGLPPVVYARRINYVAALEFQVATIAAALLAGAAMLYPRLRGREHRGRFVFLIAVVAVGTFFALTTINEDTLARRCSRRTSF